MLSANVSRKMFSISPPRNLDTFRSARTFPSSKREQSLRFIGCMRERGSNSLARFLRPRPPCVINSVASYVIDSLHGNTLSSRSSRPRRDDDSRGAKVDNAEIEFNSTYVRRNYLKTTSNCQINWKYVAAGDFTRGRGRARRGCALFMGLSITNLPRENNAKTSAPRRLTGNLLRSGENDNFPGKRREERSLLLLYILFFIRFFLLPLYAFVDSVLQTPTTWKFRNGGAIPWKSRFLAEWRDKRFREEHVRRCNFLRESRL